jgi:hypothetical protein
VSAPKYAVLSAQGALKCTVRSAQGTLECAERRTQCAEKWLGNGEGFWTGVSLCWDDDLFLNREEREGHEVGKNVSRRH